jgi:hypothetical protein
MVRECRLGWVGKRNERPKKAGTTPDFVRISKLG